MDIRVVAFVPLKMNNQRLPGKNTKKFNSGKSLYEYILKSLSNVNLIDEVYVFCSDEVFEKQLPSNVKYIKRSVSLDTDETKINEVMASFAQEVVADFYVLAHATAPFISSESISNAVKKVVKENHDSAFTVVKLQEFLWKNNHAVNYDPSEIPRTQDLEPYYVETTGLYVYSRNLIINENRRVGKNPALIEVSKIEAIDINEPVDFLIADAIEPDFN